MNSKQSSPAPSLADDLRQGAVLLAPLCGKSGLVLRLLAAIWLAVERLRVAMQTPAQADDWKSSIEGIKARGLEFGMEARPGESTGDFIVRIEVAAKRQVSP